MFYKNILTSAKRPLIEKRKESIILPKLSVGKKPPLLANFLLFIK